MRVTAKVRISVEVVLDGEQWSAECSVSQVRSMAETKARKVLGMALPSSCRMAAADLTEVVINATEVPG